MSERKTPESFALRPKRGLRHCADHPETHLEALTWSVDALLVLVLFAEVGDWEEVALDTRRLPQKLIPFLPYLSLFVPALGALLLIM